jgi:hemoglobin
MVQASGNPVLDELRAVYTLPAIRTMVHTFYGRVRDDSFIGPVFDSRIDDWEHHLGRMVSFWRSILRAEPDFKPSPRGGPPLLHQGIAELEVAHFDRWLEIFDEVTLEVFPEDAAAMVQARARRMAVVLSGGRYPHPDYAEAG